jgi:hypothetical protein
LTYKDILADADAYLIARAMMATGSSRSLADAMRTVFALSPVNRIRRFYEARFGGNVDNVVSAFAQLADGIDVAIARIGNMDTRVLKKAAHTDTLPNKEQADALARVFAAFIAEPTRR